MRHPGRDLWQRILLFVLLWISKERVAVAALHEGYGGSATAREVLLGLALNRQDQILPDDKVVCGRIY